MLIAPLDGVGRDYPLSIEKLCPVLSFYVVKDWREGCERCKQILRYGGMGHTMSIHSQNDAGHPRVRPARSRRSASCVNTPTTHGSIGLTTGLDPAMTLGCGGYGGNITSDNISPRHLLNIKRLAYEITPVASRCERARRRGVAAGSAAPASGRCRRRLRATAAPPASAPTSLIAPDRPVPGVARVQAATQSDAASGRRSTGASSVGTVRASRQRRSTSSARRTSGWRFRRAGSWWCRERAIVTPAARDLGEAASRLRRRALARLSAPESAVTAEPLGLIVDRPTAPC